jgi:Bacterial PH domain
LPQTPSSSSEITLVGVLQSIRMNYSQSVLLYQDKPKYGLLMKLILIIPVGLLASSIYLWSTGDTFVSLILLIEAFIIGLILWFVLPREYQIYENHLRIVLGVPFSVKVGFQSIETIRITSRLALTVNFTTTITRSYVEIVIRKGMSIAITPTDKESFVEKANSALSQWVKTGAWVEPSRKTTG